MVNFLLYSVPFDTYLIMFIVTVSGVKLPEVVYKVARNLSEGNAFLSILMIGIVFLLQIA
jgi:predicted permease